VDYGAKAHLIHPALTALFLNFMSMSYKRQPLRD
jgi:hypothetical protein